MNIDKDENGPKKAKKTLSRHFLEWFGMLTVGAVMLFFFASLSWWQFGVSAVEKRKVRDNFTLNNLDGGGWNFPDQHGKVLVVNYWATWCPPCRFETPGLVDLANSLKDRGVEVVGVTMNEDLADVPPFVDKYKIPYQILLPGNDPNLRTDGMALPTTFLYDKNGRLAKKFKGIVLESTLKSDIEPLLAEER